jgi:hypothetical protein
VALATELLWQPEAGAIFYVTRDSWLEDEFDPSSSRAYSPNLVEEGLSEVGAREVEE